MTVALYSVSQDRCPRPETNGPYFQEVDCDKAFDDVCVFNVTLHSAEQIPRILQQAISAAIHQRGVAHIAVPTDISISSIHAGAPITLFEPCTPTHPTEKEIRKTI